MGIFRGLNRIETNGRRDQIKHFVENAMPLDHGQYSSFIESLVELNKVTINKC